MKVKTSLILAAGVLAAGAYLTKEGAKKIINGLREKASKKVQELDRIIESTNIILESINEESTMSKSSKWSVKVVKETYTVSVEKDEKGNVKAYLTVFPEKIWKDSGNLTIMSNSVEAVEKAKELNKELVDRTFYANEVVIEWKDLSSNTSYEQGVKISDELCEICEKTFLSKTEE